jgi:anti-sigma regulatory factor (Ser/Thr protein kinase)
MFGFDRMLKLMAERDTGSDIIDLMLEELDRFTGAAHEQEDDITLVAIQRSAHADYGSDDNPSDGSEAGEGRTLAEFSLPSEPGNEREVMDRVATAVENLGIPQARLDELKTAVSEAAMNAIEHGNEGRVDLPVAVEVLTSGNDLKVRITDQGGEGAIPEVETPDIEAKLEGLQKPRGWGLFLIKNMVDDMNVESNGSHHTVELVLHLKGAADGEDTR